MKTLTSKKNADGNIQGFLLSIIGVAVVLAVGLIVLANLAQTQVDTTANCGLNETGGVANPLYTDCGAAYNTTNSVITQLATVPQWIGIIITVALAFIVLGYFYNKL